MEIQLYKPYKMLCRPELIDISTEETLIGIVQISGDVCDCYGGIYSNNSFSYIRITSRGIYGYLSPQDAQNDSNRRAENYVYDGGCVYTGDGWAFYSGDTSSEVFQSWATQQMQIITDIQVPYHFNTPISSYMSGGKDFPSGTDYYSFNIYIDSPVKWDGDMERAVRLAKDGSILWWDSEHYITSNCNEFYMRGSFHDGMVSGLRFSGQDCNRVLFAQFMKTFSDCYDPEYRHDTATSDGLPIISLIAENDTDGNNIAYSIKNRQLSRSVLGGVQVGSVFMGDSDTACSGSYKTSHQSGYAYKELDYNNANNSLVDSKALTKESLVEISPDETYLWLNKTPRLYSDIQVGNKYFVRFKNESYDDGWGMYSGETFKNPLDETKTVTGITFSGGYYGKSATIGETEYTDIIGVDSYSDAELSVVKSTILNTSHAMVDDDILIFRGKTPELFQDYSSTKQYTILYSTDFSDNYPEVINFIPMEVENPNWSDEKISILADPDQYSSWWFDSSKELLFYAKRIDINDVWLDDVWVYYKGKNGTLADKYIGWISSEPKYNTFDNNYIDDTHFATRDYVESTQNYESTITFTSKLTEELTDPKYIIITYTNPVIDTSEWSKIKTLTNGKVKIDNKYLTLKEKSIGTYYYSTVTMGTDGFRNETFVNILEDGTVSYAKTLRQSIIPLPAGAPEVNNDGEVQYLTNPEVDDNGVLTFETAPEVSIDGSLLY